MISTILFFNQACTQAGCMSHKQFILRVLETWMVVEKSRHTNQKLSRGKSGNAAHITAATAQPAMPPSDPSLWHYVTPIPKRPNVKDVQRHCQQCILQGFRKRSSYECAYCMDTPALCVGKCFRDFHMRRLHSTATEP